MDDAKHRPDELQIRGPEMARSNHSIDLNSKDATQEKLAAVMVDAVEHDNSLLPKDTYDLLLDLFIVPRSVCGGEPIPSLYYCLSG